MLLLMSFDYLKSFPIPCQNLPRLLIELLTPVGLSPRQSVEVARMWEKDSQGPDAERLFLQMAVVGGTQNDPVDVLDEAYFGVVQHSVPDPHFGPRPEFSPSISGHDYIVAAWGDDSFYTFNLAEKVWMALGLTPRCIGNEEQRLVYDDLGLPEFSVAEGEISTDYYFRLRRNMTWRMSNEYLRRYLWLRNARGVRIFHYSVQLQDSPVIRGVMGGKRHQRLTPSEGVPWYELDIRVHNGGLLLQVTASVVAVMPELCPEMSADNLLWPGDDEPMTHARAYALREKCPVHLDDRFLEKYEQSAFYDSTPSRAWENWYCSPAYRGQWSFTDCQRVGRNLIRVPMRELYKLKPDREILHAREFAVDLAALAHLNLDEEHVVAKVQRLVDVLLRLGDGLAVLGNSLGLSKSAAELVGFDREKLLQAGWKPYPVLERLGQVAPLDMTQQAFLARAKILNEVLQRIPDGYLKKLLGQAGCPRESLKDLRTLKLLQALLNILERLNANEEALDAFAAAEEPEGWSERNDRMAPIFLNNDLRIADAHEAVEKCVNALRGLGFDTADLNQGYGRAFDFVFDRVISAIDAISSAINLLIERH